MLSDEPPAEGSIHHARVVSVRPFGAFVELPGFRKQALVHHTQVSEDIHFGRDDDDEMKVKAMEFFLPRGEKVWVKVLEVRPDAGGARLAASMRAVNQEDGTDLDPDNVLALAGGRGGGGGGGGGGGRDSDQPPELYSIHRAAVQQVRPFGVFVKIDGYRKFGLVHFSQISEHIHFAKEDSDEVKMKEIGEILSIGDPVWVKVVDVTHDERGPKIGCSIKNVSQGDGTDLDPANTKYRPRGEGGAPQAPQPIGAAAGTTTQEGGIEWGHLKADVVQYGTGGKYDIIADSDEERRPGASGRGRPLPPQRPGPPGAPGGVGSGANMAPIQPSNWGDV
ncbi:S1 RNA binding domain-containing [Micractinium conductrix]|uniref:S1 RNA binding domain-containing n=1 Tax=Micractinium conductrix TaxID=554055 RepID=A0A2P6VQT9_9CHLO|nr:S1 RNA binding domain-containing [Micractinium conductrix]|eukprot:PSC76425.1 S1 RNA binding domain-containing [Micractinium conductrix]